MNSEAARWRLGRRPALDGLRGVAVLLVVTYHGVVLVGATLIPSAGTAGVSVFFTLSGFLITSLLLDELDRTGHLNLRAFYARRARRLLPALVVLVVASGVVALFRAGFVSVGSEAASLLFVQNWWGIDHPAQPNALNHTWSLSIEEQFYLAWPLLLTVLARWGGRRAVIIAACIGAVTALVLREVYWSAGAGAWRIYAGTDVRMDGLLIGCALAALMRGLSVERSRPGCVAGGLAACAVGSLMLGWGYFVLAPLVAALGGALMIYGAAQGSGSRLLAWRPLRWFGVRSYGLYLWHIFVFELLVIHPVAAPVMLSAFVAGSLALTELSWRYIEAPFRSRALLSRSPSGEQAEQMPSTFPTPHERHPLPGLDAGRRVRWPVRTSL